MKRRHEALFSLLSTRQKHALPAALKGEVMTLREVAQYLNCSATTIHVLLDRREIPAFRIGDHWRFRRYDIEEWITAFEVGRCR